jgi:aromatic-L-amino-acid decarboxylase
VTDFREDGAAALEWTARYLERVGEPVVFRRNGSDEENEHLEERVNASGEMFITHTKLDGATSSGSRSATRGRRRDDVRRAWDVLNREAER